MEDENGKWGDIHEKEKNSESCRWICKTVNNTVLRKITQTEKDTFPHMHTLASKLQRCVFNLGCLYEKTWKGALGWAVPERKSSRTWVIWKERTGFGDWKVEEDLEG